MTIFQLKNVNISVCPSRGEPKRQKAAEKPLTKLQRVDNLQSNKEKKLEFKKMKKQRKKSSKDTYKID